MNNFTPRAQQVLALARKEADRFNHNFVGTEHLLLGLIKLGQGVAVNVLQKLGLDLETVRRLDSFARGGVSPVPSERMKAISCRISSSVTCPLNVGMTGWKPATTSSLGYRIERRM